MNVIEKLYSVVTFELNKKRNKCIITEKCEGYFNEKLTKKEMEELIDNLIDIYNNMI